MTAPTRQQLRPSRPATLEQLLVLADRAERGPLTAAEAARLRDGIETLARHQREASGRSAAHTVRSTRAVLLIASLVAAARRRGQSTLPVALVEAALTRSRPAA